MLIDDCWLAGGRLEDALDHYKRAKKFGVEKAEVHIRNVSFRSFDGLHAFLKYIQMCLLCVNHR